MAIIYNWPGAIWNQSDIQAPGKIQEHQTLNISKFADVAGSTALAIIDTLPADKQAAIEAHMTNGARVAISLLVAGPGKNPDVQLSLVDDAGQFLWLYSVTGKAILGMGAELN